MDNSKICSTKYFAKIAYDGSYYHGYNKQPGFTPTIQDTIENLLYHVFHSKIKILAASRTDRYVHAYDQAITFSLVSQLIIQSQTVKTILNENLPSDIRVNSVVISKDQQLSVRHNCYAKTYLYKISFRGLNPFTSKYNYFMARETLKNLDKLSSVLALFIGSHNFQSYFNYYGKLPEKTNFQCEIFDFIYKINSQKLHFYIKGTRFGRNMVRLIIGDVIDFLLGKYSLTQIHDRLLNPSKKYLIFKAPPQGLYLYKTYFTKIH